MKTNLTWVTVFRGQRPHRYPSQCWVIGLHTRLAQHEAGNGARLTQVALERGIGWTLARLWWGTRKTERQLKNRKEGPRLCPICHPDSCRNPDLAKLDY